jgi:c-di-GMP-binding flagellar brake protein YcgR
MVERRKYERYDLVVPAIVETLARTAAKRKITLKTVNVSAGGAYFRTEAILAEGTKVRLELRLSYDSRHKLKNPRNARIRMLGTVMRCKDGGMAIRFSEDYVIAPIPAKVQGVG